MGVFVENATKLAMERDDARKAAAEAIREGLKALAEMRTRAEAAEARATAAEAQVARIEAETIERCAKVAETFGNTSTGHTNGLHAYTLLGLRRGTAAALRALTQEPHDAK